MELAALDAREAATTTFFKSDKETVMALGATLFDYLPDLGFVARMDAVSATAVAALDAIRWVKTLRPDFRVEPSLADGLAENGR